MKRTNSTTFMYNGINCPINTKEGQYESYCGLLDKGIKQLIMMLNKHCKTLTIRLDVHMPEHIKLNTNFELFVDYLKRYIQRTYSTKHVA